MTNRQAVTGMARIERVSVDEWVALVWLEDEEREQQYDGFSTAQEARKFLSRNFPRVVVTGPRVYEEYRTQRGAPQRS